MNSVSLKDLVFSTSKKSRTRSRNSRVIGIKTRKNFKRFIFNVKSSEIYSRKSGHLTSIRFPGIDVKRILEGKTAPKSPNTTKPIRVWCSCPAFQFWGSAFWSTEMDYNIDQRRTETRPPNIRDPNRNFLVCKHLIAVHNRLKKFSLKRLINSFGGKK